MPCCSVSILYVYSLQYIHLDAFSQQLFDTLFGCILFVDAPDADQFYHWYPLHVLVVTNLILALDIEKLL